VEILLVAAINPELGQGTSVGAGSPWLRKWEGMNISRG